MSKPRMLPLLLLLSFACDSSSATPATPAKDATAKKDDAKKGDAAAKPAVDEAKLIADGKTAAMSVCSLPVADFTEAKMKTSEALVGSVLHVWSKDASKKRERRQFVAKKAAVRAIFGKEVEIYVTTDDTDPCSLPKNENINVATGPVVQTKSGNEVVIVRLADSKLGKYIGRSLDETMADMMGGPENWLGVGYTVSDAAVTAYKPGDANFPWVSLNSEGRSYLDLTAYEAGKRLQAKIHACIGAEEFLIGPIDATFCPDAQPKI